MTVLQTNRNFFTTTQKTLFFCFFFIFLFSFSMFFMFCLFLFPTWKRQKQKVHIFFSKTLFLTPWQTAKKLFSHPYTLFVFFLDTQKTTIKLGKNKQTKILDQVLTQPWTRFWLKKPQILDQVLTLQHMYIYMAIYIYILPYIYAVESKLGPRFGFLSQNLVQGSCLIVPPNLIVFFGYLKNANSA